MVPQALISVNLVVVTSNQLYTHPHVHMHLFYVHTYTRTSMYIHIQALPVCENGVGKQSMLSCFLEAILN